MLNETNTLPEGLLEARTNELLSIIKAPTLIHLEGNIKKPLFICTLLHGNETTGFYAVQRLLQEYKNKTLPRSISIFIGNVEAAAENKRRLDTQADYNRIWPGTHHSDSAETDMMKTVSNIMQKRKPFASIDIHNNTGNNPHYACINILNPRCLQLAGIFSNTIVYFTSPKGVQSAAFSDFCPELVLECGQSGQEDGVTHSAEFLRSALNLETISSDKPAHINLYHTVARVTIPEAFTFDISKKSDIQLSQELENRNFDEIESGSVFAGIDSDKDAHVVVTNESDENVTNEFFEIKNNKLILKKDVTLSMYTTNERAIKQDCLCYLMERIHIE
jgi:succinylglutamate desuccinylase